ncbi:MAG: hypothetical protein U0414_18975 [Polyangiaceae bacterium]
MNAPRVLRAAREESWIALAHSQHIRRRPIRPMPIPPHRVRAALHATLCLAVAACGSPKASTAPSGASSATASAAPRASAALSSSATAPPSSVADIVTAISGHGVVLKYSVDYTDYAEIAARVSAVPGVVASAPFAINPMRIAVGGKQADILGKGIDLEKESRVADLERFVVAGSLAGLRATIGERGVASEKAHPCDGVSASAALPGVAISKALGERLGVSIGSCVEIQSVPPPNKTAPGPRAFRVVAEHQTGIESHDPLVFIDLPSSQALIGMGDTVTGIEFKTNDPEKAAETSERISRELTREKFHVLDWKVLNHGLLEAPPPHGK